MDLLSIMHSIPQGKGGVSDEKNCKTFSCIHNKYYIELSCSYRNPIYYIPAFNHPLKGILPKI